jgi:hypothetical protein
MVVDDFGSTFSKYTWGISLMHPTNNKTKFKYSKWTIKQSTNYVEIFINNVTWSGDLPQAKKT